MNSERERNHRGSLTIVVQLNGHFNGTIKDGGRLYEIRGTGDNGVIIEFLRPYQRIMRE